MGKFDQVAAALETLPEERREEIAAIIETLFHGDLHPESALSDTQIADLQTRLADPGPIATDEQVEAFFGLIVHRVAATRPAPLAAPRF